MIDPSGEDERPEDEREQAARQLGDALRWELGRAWMLPSTEEVERRFDELIRRRWAEAREGSGGSWVVLEREIWVEMDLPGVAERKLRARVELRSESGSLRLRIREPEE
jgi:hypothetical protein